MKKRHIVLSCCVLLAAAFGAVQDVETPNQPATTGELSEYSLEVTVGPPRGAVRIPSGDAPSWPSLVSVRAVHRPSDGASGGFISIRNIEVFPGEEEERRRSQGGYTLWCVSNIDPEARTADVDVGLVHDGRFVLHQRFVVDLSRSIPPGK